MNASITLDTPTLEPTRARVSVPVLMRRDAEPTVMGERLARLFRASLGSGRIHPLYLPLVQYQSAKHADRVQ